MAKYEILKTLGRGNFATVFKSRLKQTDVAVKRFEKLRLSKNAADELNILKRVSDHKNIVKFMEWSIDDNFIYIVTELGDLGDLEQYLISNFPELGHKLLIMNDSVTGLEFLHSATPPIIHRDIKLENIILKRSGSGFVAKLCDFGLSKLFTLGSMELRMSTKEGKGTYSYKAPELLVHGRKQYDASVDVFSLGLVFMILLNHSEKFQKLEPYPESVNTGSWQAYGQMLRSVREYNKPPPALFTLTSDDKWPVTELKALITFMVAYEASDRVSSEHVMKALTNIRASVCGEVPKYRLKENLMDVQNQLENVSMEKSKLQSQLTEALQQLSVRETQVRERDQALSDKSELIKEKDRVLSSTIEKKDRVVQEKEKTIKNLTSEMDRYKQQVTEKDKHLHEKKMTVQREMNVV